MSISNYKVKVPHMSQMEATECGAACLAMILAYYGKWVPLEKVRESCGINRDGTNAKNILLAARSYGLSGKGRMMSIDALMTKHPLPCILHWEFSHFVVLTGFTRNKVLINDPSGGEMKLSMEEFEKKFTGIVLTFEKTEEFKPEGNPPDVLGYVINRLKGLKRGIVFIMILSALSSLSLLLYTSASRTFMDDILSGDHPEWLEFFIWLMVVLVIINATAGVLNAIYLLRIQGKAATVAQTVFLRHMLYLPMGFFSQRSTGDLQLRQGENETIVGTLLGQLSPLLVNSIMLVLYIVVMVRDSVILTVIGVLTVIINAWSAHIVSGKRLSIVRVMQADAGKLYGITVAGIDTIESIKASGTENEFFGSWAGYQANVNEGSLKIVKLSEYFELIPQALTSLTNILVLTLGIYQIMKGAMTTGSLLAFTGLMSAFLNPVMQIIRLGQTIQEAQTQMERIEDVMRYPEDVNDEREATGPAAGLLGGKLSGKVDIEHISFGYSSLEPPLIADFSLHMEPGKWVALVGASGSGKSTVTKLVSGLLKPWSGDIFFDGVPIGDIPGSVFRSSLSVVDQEIITFNDSIAENIKMWDHSIEDFEMILACRDAEIYEDIKRRPGGYQEIINPGGSNFSGGQLQRMEIARVLAQEPTIVILDEATSALDAETEARVIKHIRDRGVTCIVSAHRLSTIRNCDEIIVLDGGKIAERGTHSELMAADGLYARLIRSE